MLFEEITWEQFAEIRAKEVAAESFKKGVEQGCQQGMMNIVEKMLKKGMSDKEIIELTGCEQQLIDTVRAAKE